MLYGYAGVNHQLFCETVADEVQLGMLYKTSYELTNRRTVIAVDTHGDYGSFLFPSDRKGSVSL